MKKLKLFESLRFKMVIVAIILIAIPIITISISYSNIVKDIITKKYTESAIQSVYENGEKIKFILDDIKEFSTLVISDENFLNMLKNSDDYTKHDYDNKLRSFIKLRDDIEVIDLITENKYYSIGAKKIKKGEAIYGKLTASFGEPIWLPTKMEKIEILSGRFDKRYFTLGRKIIDFNTLDDYGYLLFNLDELILEQSYRNLIDNHSVELFICNEYGKIISNPDKDKIGKTIIFEPYGNKILADKEGNNYAKYKDKNGVEKVAIYSTIELNGWKIIKTISTDYLYAEINKIQNYLILGGIFYCLGIIFFILFFSYKYTEPIIKMKSTMLKVEQGDLSVRVEASSNDEIGQLGNSFNNMISETQILIDKLVEEEQSKKELELESLHAQINPHFLYNTLNTIKWMAKIQGNNSVSTAITALVKLLRISINLGKDMITLDEELEYVKNYLVIQRLRFNESINANFDIDQTLLKVMVPKLILQPIVENSIIYGFNEERDDLNIIIKAREVDKILMIDILDDGPGIKNELLEGIFEIDNKENRFSKVGLNNVNQRIKLCFGKEYGIKIYSEIGKGTRVNISLPIK